MTQVHQELMMRINDVFGEEAFDRERRLIARSEREFSIVLAIENLRKDISNCKDAMFMAAYVEDFMELAASIAKYSTELLRFEQEWRELRSK